MSAIRILVDADACPVKDEVYRVAFRREVAVCIVSNARIRIPDHPLVERMVVSDGFDAADDWIVAQAGASDVVITATSCSPIVASRREPPSLARPASRSPTPASAARSRRARSWPICASRAMWSADRRRSPRRIARASCRRSMKRWCGWRGAEAGFAMPTNGLDPRSIIVKLVAGRGPDKTICPSEAARVIGGEDWREAMPVIHAAARALAKEGAVELRQGGEPCGSEGIVGPYRIAGRV